MQKIIPIEDVFHSDAEAASAALRRVGATPLPALDLTLDHPTLGPVVRRFGLVMASATAHGTPAMQRIAILRTRPENAGLAADWDRLDHLPSNKQLVREIAAEVLFSGVHLPWAFLPLNVDFAMRVERRAQEAKLSFRFYYSRVIDVTEDGSSITLRRVFSLPVGGSAHGTFDEPHHDRALDADVGLLLEANARG